MLRANLNWAIERRAEITYAVQDSGFHEEVSEVSGQEFNPVWQEMKLIKAPGIDGILNNALKAAIENNVDVFRKVFDACVQERTLPRIWRKDSGCFLSRMAGRTQQVITRFV